MGNNVCCTENIEKKIISNPKLNIRNDISFNTKYIDTLVDLSSDHSIIENNKVRNTTKYNNKSSLKFFIKIFQNNFFSKAIINKMKFEEILFVNNTLIFYKNNNSLHIDKIKKIENEIIFQINYNDINRWEIIKNLISFLSKVLTTKNYRILGYKYNKYNFILYTKYSKSQIINKSNKYKFITILNKDFNIEEFISSLESYKKLGFYFYYMLEYYDNILIILKMYEFEISVKFQNLDQSLKQLDMFYFNKKINNIISNNSKILQIFCNKENELILIYKE